MPPAADHYDAYLLVHPERYPSNDPEGICQPLDPGELDHALERLGGFDEPYGRQVRAQAAGARRRIAILDPSDLELLADELVDAGLLVDHDYNWPAGRLLDAVRAALSGIPAGDENAAAAQLTVGVAAAGWDLHVAAPLEVAQASRRAFQALEPPGRVLVGGYARHDCVKRVAAAARRAGHTADVCDRTALPLRPSGLQAYLDET